MQDVAETSSVDLAGRMFKRDAKSAEGDGPRTRTERDDGRYGSLIPYLCFGDDGLRNLTLV